MKFEKKIELNLGFRFPFFRLCVIFFPLDCHFNEISGFPLASVNSDGTSRVCPVAEGKTILVILKMLK